MPYKVTFADISTMHADLGMKFYKTVEQYTLLSSIMDRIEFSDGRRVI